MEKQERLALEEILKGKREFHKEIMEITNAIRIHAEKDVKATEKLFCVRFPSEPLNIQEYRLENLPYITKAYFDKVLSVLYKIKASPDFYVSHDDQAFAELTKDVPDFVFKNLLKVCLVDPNAYYFYTPGQQVLFKSESIVYDGEFVAVKEGEIYRIFADTEYLEVEFEKNKLVIRLRYDMPAKSYLIKLGGTWATVDQKYYESFLQGAVESWSNALIMYSDLIVGIKQHVFPEKYRYVTTTCKACNGSGAVEYTEFETTYTNVCRHCNGTGTPPTGVMSEYQILIQSGSGIMEEALKIPNPPAGYIQKDIETMDFIMNAYKQFIHDGLAAVSMEFLAETGVNQSGVAKEMDRSELNNFLSMISEHVQYLLRRCYENWITFYQTGSMPQVSVPQTFDYMFRKSELEDLSAIKQNTSISTHASAVKEYISSNFYGEEQRKLMLTVELDPLYGYELEEKIRLQEVGLCTQIELYVSIHIRRLVDQLAREDGWFSRRTNINKLRELIYGIAQSEIKNVL